MQSETDMWERFQHGAHVISSLVHVYGIFLHGMSCERSECDYNCCAQYQVATRISNVLLGQSERLGVQSGQAEAEPCQDT